MKYKHIVIKKCRKCPFCLYFEFDDENPICTGKYYTEDEEIDGYEIDEEFLIYLTDLEIIHPDCPFEDYENEHIEDDLSL